MKWFLLALIVLFFPNLTYGYMVEGDRSTEIRTTIERAKVSWYDCGKRKTCKTANGEWFQKDTAACHSRYPFGTKFRISYKENRVVVTCRDRGSFEKNGSKVFLDISKSSFSLLEKPSRGIIYTKVEQL